MEKNLKSFDMASLDEIRKVRSKMLRCGGNNRKFWDELEEVITRPKYSPSDWERMENDEVVLGEVWSQSIGEFHYKHTVHRFTYLYVDSEGLASDGVAITTHGPHEELIHNGKHVRKIKEWYIFPDGRMELCPKDSKHQLINNCGHPIYVISIKIASKG